MQQSRLDKYPGALSVPVGDHRWPKVTLESGVYSKRWSVHVIERFRGSNELRGFGRA